ncbi:MAG TPA: RNA polymerase subunit sigma-70 [Streptosporangiaceae bacterium]|nr:RNA polymerase subunit sigma-70 [Streptosporangiaceae bacterium]
MSSRVPAGTAPAGTALAGTALATAAADGDQAAFDELARLHRRELHVHCYRMLASFDDAEDAVQEALLRAWRGRSGLSGGGPEYRAWLYRIATNVCLDMLRARSRQATTLTSFADVPWLQPYPDRLLDEVAPADGQPDEVAVSRETIELAFLAALQVLPPRQRAALIFRDVLGWPASETAALLETTVAGANSAVQRARSMLRAQLPGQRTDWRAVRPTAAERQILKQFIDAHERYDPEAIASILATDIRVTMPPYPRVFDGLAGMEPLFERAFGPARDGDWLLLPAAANRMAAAGSYLRRPGDSLARPFKLDVLRIDGGVITEITTFGPASFPGLGLPPVHPGPG